MKVLSILFIMSFLSSFAANSRNLNDGESINSIKNSFYSTDDAIEWIDFETAEKQTTNNTKKYFVYVYTDWCGYCKRMSNTTFQDDETIKLLNDKFIPIKFNAESKEPIKFNDRDFKFIANGSRGYHELAAALLNNQLSYPTLVFLDEKMNMIQPLPGYKSADDLNIILRFLGDNIYEKMSFDEYYKQETGD